MTLMATEAINAELTAAVQGRSRWSMHYLGTSTLKAMYAPSNNIRGFIYPSHEGGDWNGWTWFVLQGSSRMNPDEAPEPTAEKAVHLLEEFVARLDRA
jgi:hypothetical protein